MKMPKWSVEMGKYFKSQQNPEYIGIVEGTIEQVEPIAISIYNKQIIFHKEKIYTCKHVLPYTETIQVIVNGESGSGTVQHDGIKQGDKVACMITEDNQKLFVLDIVV